MTPHSNNYDLACEPYLRSLVALIEQSTGCSLAAPSLDKEHIIARHSYYYLARTRTPATYRGIGALIGRKSSTAVVGFQVACNRLLYDPVFRTDYQALEKLASQLAPLTPTMEAIVKINTHTAQAIDTLTLEAFCLGERLAGESPEELEQTLDKLRKQRLLQLGHYTYVYMPATYLSKQQPQAPKP